VAQPDYGQSGGINNPARAMSVSINGQPSSQTVVRLDGVAATNQFSQGIQSYTPGLESIEIINVVTNAFDADQGMAGGAAVNVQIKSGTNIFKGSTFFNAVDARMRARHHFLPAHLTKGTSSVHVFGGTLGGPIVRNKFFFFFADESTRQRTRGGDAVGQTGSNGFQNLPPADLRAGNFANTGTVIYDPRTGTATGTGRTPFAYANCPGVTTTTDPRFASCNFIPANRINPISKAMLEKLIMPTLPGYNNNYYATSGYDSTYHKIDSKFTFAPGPKLNLNGRYSYLPGWEDSTGILPSVDSNPNPLSQGRRWTSSVISTSVAATSILSPTLVFDTVWGFTKHDVFVAPNGDYKCWGYALDVPIPNACQPPRSLDTAFPSISAGGFLLAGSSPIRDYVDPQWELNANVAWTRGSHNIKAGVDYQNLHQNHYETQAQAFTFGSGPTSLSGGTAGNNFNSFASFLLGEVTSRSAQAMTPLLGEPMPVFEEGVYPEFRVNTLRTMQFGSYVRDQWQINSKMTASVGLRWEYYALPTRSTHGLEVYDFETNQLQICGVNGLHKTCGIGVEKNLFTPRLGLAYRPTEDSVIRIGYSRNPQNDNPGRQQMTPSQAFPETIIISEPGPNTFTAVGNFSEGSPLVPLVDLSTGLLTLPRGTGVTTFRDEFVRGKISSWNVTYQRVLPFSLSGQIGYVANRQNGMVRNHNENYGQLGGGSASQPFFKYGITSAMSVQTANGKQTYDSLQVSVNRRMVNGFSFTTAYTFAKSVNWWAGGIAIPEYYYLNKGDVTSTPHKLNISTIYELPFGPGKPFLDNDGVATKVLQGWQLNSFISAQSGNLVNVSTSGNSLNAPGSSQRPDKVKEGPVTIFGDTCTTCAYWDVTFFKPVTEVRFGNSGIGHFRGPTAPNFDLSLFRTFRLTGQKTLQFRVECFNISNTPHYANPSANVSNVIFNADGTVQNLNGVGSISDTTRTGRQYDEREWRIGLRMGF
jgi:hypothetical protein